jgi:glycosyltransferase involved in cell wall biosynthesis
MADPQVSVILPVYNQADHIQQIISGYLSSLENLKLVTELILVVNGSRDHSMRRCLDAAKANPLIRVMQNEKPGWGRAVRTGLSEAQGRLLCYTNSARTNPYDLAMHIMLAAANPGMVIKANRRLRSPFVRRVGSVLYNAQCRQLFNLAVWDVNGTPKTLERENYCRMNLTEDGDLIDLEFVVECMRLGIQIVEVPIVSSERHGGESTTNYFSALKMYFGAFRMWRYQSNDGRRDQGAH